MKISCKITLVFLITIVFSINCFIEITSSIDANSQFNKEESSERISNSPKLSAAEHLEYILDENRVNTYTLLDQEMATLCVLTSDRSVVVWASDEQDGSDYGIYATLINTNTGRNVTAETRINTYTSLNQYNPRICTLSHEKIAIVWQSNGQDGDGYGIYGIIFNTTSWKNITSEFRINNFTADNQFWPVVCALSSDSFAVAWGDMTQDGSGRGVYATIINGTSGKNITSETRINTYTLNDQENPGLTLLSPERIAVVWRSEGQDGDSFGMFGTILNATNLNNITNEFQINTYTSSSQAGREITTISPDLFAVCWASYEQDGDAWGAYGTVINATTCKNITLETQINTYTLSSQSPGDIRLLCEDLLVISWNSGGQDGSGNGVYASIFNATTLKRITSDKLVNRYTDNSQFNPTIGILSDDTFVITWNSDGQDGSDIGVYMTVIRKEALTMDKKKDKDEETPNNILGYDIFFLLFFIGISFIFLSKRHGRNLD